MPEPMRGDKRMSTGGHAMAKSELSPEQHQVQQEIKAVEASLAKAAGAANEAFELEQGRKLIEKAVKVGLPEDAYADLRRRVTSHDGKPA